MAARPAPSWQKLSALLEPFELPPGAVMRAGEPGGPYRLSMILGTLRKHSGLQVRVKLRPLGRWRLIPAGEWYAYEVLPDDRLRHARSGEEYILAEARRLPARDAPRRSRMEQRCDLIRPYIMPDRTAAKVFQLALLDHPGHELLTCGRSTRHDAVDAVLGQSGGVTSPE
jgi:hypothetical protein